MNEPKYVVVVGASAGGMRALTELVAGLDQGSDIAVFIVMHLSGTSISNFLAIQLQPHTNFVCQVATHNEIIKRGHIYIGAHSNHLVIKKGTILLGGGPEENRWRPSIDVLFRSAAAAYSTRVIGVILTGLLDDGTAGMSAISRSGGATIVQDPNEAEFPDMPLAVLNSMEVDHCISLSSMADMIHDISQVDAEEVPAPTDVIIESQIAERTVVDYEHVKQLGVKSIYACPDCGGGLWNVNVNNGKADRYRCHIGHAYTEGDLMLKQGAVLESTLWIALRIMEERRNLLKKMERENLRNGLTKTAHTYEQKGATIQFHVDKLKEVLFATQATL